MTEEEKRKRLESQKAVDINQIPEDAGIGEKAFRRIASIGQNLSDTTEFGRASANTFELAADNFSRGSNDFSNGNVARGIGAYTKGAIQSVGGGIAGAATPFEKMSNTVTDGISNFASGFSGDDVTQATSPVKINLKKPPVPQTPKAPSIDSGTGSPSAPQEDSADKQRYLDNLKMLQTTDTRVQSSSTPTSIGSMSPRYANQKNIYDWTNTRAPSQQSEVERLRDVYAMRQMQDNYAAQLELQDQIRDLDWRGTNQKRVSNKRKELLSLMTGMDTGLNSSASREVNARNAGVNERNASVNELNSLSEAQRRQAMTLIQQAEDARAAELQPYNVKSKVLSNAQQEIANRSSLRNYMNPKSEADYSNTKKIYDTSGNVIGEVPYDKYTGSEATVRLSDKEMEEYNKWKSSQKGN